MPDNFGAARRALTERFPEARGGIDQLLGDMERIAARCSPQAGGSAAQVARSRFPRRDWLAVAVAEARPVFGDNEAVKCALAANLSYYHDDPATLWWIILCDGAGSYLQSGGRYVQGGSQRLSSALARAIRTPAAKCWCAVSSAASRRTRKAGPTSSRTPRRTAAIRRPWKRRRSSAMPRLRRSRRCCRRDAAQKTERQLRAADPSISLFALTLGLSKPPREFGVSAYSTQLLPPWMKRLSDYRKARR